MVGDAGNRRRRETAAALVSICCGFAVDAKERFLITSDTSESQAKKSIRLWIEDTVTVSRRHWCGQINNNEDQPASLTAHSFCRVARSPVMSTIWISMLVEFCVWIWAGQTCQTPATVVCTCGLVRGSESIRTPTLLRYRKVAWRPRTPRVRGRPPRTSYWSDRNLMRKSEMRYLLPLLNRGLLW